MATARPTKTKRDADGDRTPEWYARRQAHRSALAERCAREEARVNRVLTAIHQIAEYAGNDNVLDYLLEESFDPGVSALRALFIGLFLSGVVEAHRLPCRG